MNASAASSLPLAGRTALVTGVSRHRGIGLGVSRRLAELGASVFVQHYSPHDADQPWGADDIDSVRAAIRSALTSGADFGDWGLDLAEPTAPRRLIDAAVDAFGHLDILICNHARSGGDGSIFEMTAETLDTHWSVNARSTLLLTRYFAEQFAPDSFAPIDELATGRVIWMTSGQHEGPMPGEVAYATSKAALAGITPTVAAELLTRGILLNTVNPGPVNTGYLDDEPTDRSAEIKEGVKNSMPLGRFGLPSDPARLIAWLVSEEGRWMVGQVLTSDGGFSLS
ncbi:SDR family oxidoreductase [Agreia pratensis]|uniref:3-oxoacyl-[acyl-carrier protein] reductase n=1 Tax=Agreia pratensis TaxID=150121 RepID=A0A1X7JS28_9MICO|nr:SDR family oxidoreductase [Agreia pratensis]SMG31084.1 3-oxoacyl-[acyl-carrier protein] reductase [Agreia pratensis]